MLLLHVLCMTMFSLFQSYSFFTRTHIDDFVQDYQGSKLRGAEGQNAPWLTLNAPRLLSVGAKFCSLFKIRYVMQRSSFAPVMATFAATVKPLV